jgi:HAD superfamily hydrolase (TIGR01509 family)
MTKLAIILDMDGLMLDTETVSFRAWQQAAGDLGYLLDDALYGMMIGLSQQANSEMLRRHFGDDCPVDDLVRSADARYRALLDADGVPQKPGLLDFIRFLDDRKIPRAVATSTRTELASRTLRQAGILHHFEILIGGEQVSRGKPAPDIFLEAAFRLLARPADCAVLEDSPPGIQAAAAAGMKAILIPDGREPSDDVRRAAFAVVESLAAAQAVIERLLEDQ